MVGVGGGEEAGEVEGGGGVGPDVLPAGGAVEVFGVGGGGEGGGELGDGEVVEGVFDGFGDGAGVGGGDEAVFEPWCFVSTGEVY